MTIPYIFSNAHPTVRLALALPNTHIVTYAWLEDSLLNGRKLAERKYTWEEQRAQRRRRKMYKRMGPDMDRKRFEEGCEAARGDLGSGTSKRKGGFFASALGELRERREAREREAAQQGLQGDGNVAEKEDIDAPEDARRKRSSKRKTDLQPTAMPPSARLASLTSTSTLPSSSPSTTLPPASSSALLPTPLLPPSTSSPAKPANVKLQDLYHIYLDPTGFEYKLLLVRQNPHLNTLARYDLRMYESHTVPHVYCTLVRYVPPVGGEASIAMGVGSGGSGGDGEGTGSGSGGGGKGGEKGGDCREGGEVGDDDSATTTTTTPSTSTIAHIQPGTPAPAPAPHAHAHTILTPTPTTITLSPPSTPFHPSFATFRHAFRDLTLLAWHERFDTDLQALRAKAFQIEPFVWRKPGFGQPLGVMPGEWAFGGHGGSQWEYVEEGYVRNRWGLPGLEVRLGGGMVGLGVKREEREREWGERVKVEEEEREIKREKGEEGRKKSGRKAEVAVRVEVKQTQGVGRAVNSGDFKSRKDRRPWPKEVW